MKQWPPVLWLPVYIASELILLGSHRRLALLAAGGALCLIALGSALWLALRPDPEHPRPRWFFGAILGVVLCYVPSAVAAATLGVIWAAGALAASTIPTTAVALLLATVRQKTVATESGARDASGDQEDPYPGIGLDERSPLGDTSEHAEEREDPAEAQAKADLPRARSGLPSSSRWQAKPNRPPTTTRSGNGQRRTAPRPRP
jgi:hypothetical protein